MEARDRRKYQLETLLHEIDGGKKISAAYREVCQRSADGGMVIVAPVAKASLREMIQRIVDAEFPPCESGKACPAKTPNPTTRVPRR
jgi:hypothetical protein